MALNTAAAVSTILTLPFTIAPAFLQSRPKSKLQKWNERIEEISAKVAFNGDVIKSKEMKRFLDGLRLYNDAKDTLLQKIKDGDCTWYSVWYGKGKGYAYHFTLYAREVYELGQYLSTEGSKRKAESSTSIPNELWLMKIELITAKVASNRDMIMPEELEEFLRVLELCNDARDSSGNGDDYSDYARKTCEIGLIISTQASKRKAQSSLPHNAQIPTTSLSLVNKGKSRQVSSSSSSLSEESPLKNGPHSKNSLDTASASEPSIPDSNNSGCLPKALPSSSLPPLYSETDSDASDAISVNLKDDTDLEDDIDSDSESNNMAPEQHGRQRVIYELFSQIPEEPSPWESTVSLHDFLDRLRARGLIR